MDEGSSSRKMETTGILKLDISKPRRSSGSSVDFKFPEKSAIQIEPPSPQPSVDRLSVTFADRSDCSESSVKVNIFDPGSPPAVQTIAPREMVTFSTPKPAEKNDDEDDDYSVSVTQILNRRESTRRSSQKRRRRRPSSPFSPDREQNIKRRASVYTNSSAETTVSIEQDSTTQEQIFENIRLHKEVLSNVKYQPWGMRRKIKLVQQAKVYIKKHEGELQERLAMSKSTKDFMARFNIWFIKRLQYFRRESANMMNQMIPWELRIKEIESHFGSAVASYFTFLRWMFWVNLVISVVIACFMVVPEMLTAEKTEGNDRKSVPDAEKATALNLATLWDFEGILKYSPIFYGFYSNEEKKGAQYRLPFAYFMTGIAVYVYSFVATLRKMAKNSRMSKLSEKDDECTFTWKLFTGWDYMIGNAETAHNRVASIILGFKEALLEETERKKEEKKWKVIGLRVLVNFIVLSLLVFSAYLVFIVVERSTKPEADDSWWRQNEITVSLSVITLIFPIFFEVLGLLEGYHPRKCLRIQLARIMILNLLNLYTLIFSLFWKISSMVKELETIKSNLTSTTPYIPFTTMSSCRNISVDCSTIATALLLTSTILPTTPGTVTQSISTDILIHNSPTPMSTIPSSTWSTTSTDGTGISLLEYEDEKLSTTVKSINDDDPYNIAFMTAFLQVLKKNFFSLIRNNEETTQEPELSTTTEVTKTVSTSEPSLCFITECDNMENENSRESPVIDPETRKKLTKLCWETMFGQELVKLTVMDLVLTIASILLVDFFRALFVRFMNHCWCWDLEKQFPQYGDFKIAENILHLVNNQGMVWMGMFFSPGLPAINLIKLGIMMYLRSWAVLTCNVPHEVVFRASRSNNFYLALLLTMLFLCVLPVGYAIVWIDPSWHCGPFSGYRRIYHIFTDYLQRVIPKSFQRGLDYIASPAIIIPLLMLLILIIYYLVSLTNSLREANTDLKTQLRRERTEERRKMFQLVDRKIRKGSGGPDSAFAKWKKILPDFPTKGEENDVQEEVNSKKEVVKKELLAKLLKKARAGKDAEVGLSGENTDAEPESLPQDVPQVKAININEKRDSVPVIKISKTESHENILDQLPASTTKTANDKRKFRDVVRRHIEIYRGHKEKLRKLIKNEEVDDKFDKSNSPPSNQQT